MLEEEVSRPHEALVREDIRLRIAGIDYATNRPDNPDGTTGMRP